MWWCICRLAGRKITSCCHGIRGFTWFPAGTDIFGVRLVQNRLSSHWLSVNIHIKICNSWNSNLLITHTICQNVVCTKQLFLVVFSWKCNMLKRWSVYELSDFLCLLYSCVLVSCDRLLFVEWYGTVMLHVLYVCETWFTLAEECRLRVKEGIEEQDVHMVSIEHVTSAFMV